MLKNLNLVALVVVIFSFLMCGANASGQAPATLDDVLKELQKTNANLTDLKNLVIKNQQETNLQFAQQGTEIAAIKATQKSMQATLDIVVTDVAHIKVRVGNIEVNVADLRVRVGNVETNVADMNKRFSEALAAQSAEIKWLKEQPRQQVVNNHYHAAAPAPYCGRCRCHYNWAPCFRHDWTVCEWHGHRFGVRWVDGYGYEHRSYSVCTTVGTIVLF
jgi:hypothetical protein